MLNLVPRTLRQRSRKKLKISTLFLCALITAKLQGNPLNGVKNQQHNSEEKIEQDRKWVRNDLFECLHFRLLQRPASSQFICFRAKAGLKLSCSRKISFLVVPSFALFPQFIDPDDGAGDRKACGDQAGQEIDGL